jgi:hypothetical protein
MFPGLSSSIRVGLPSEGDPHGQTGPGNWWITGGCQPAYMWGRGDLPSKPARGIRRLWRRIKR